MVFNWPCKSGCTGTRLGAHRLGVNVAMEVLDLRLEAKILLTMRQMTKEYLGAAGVQRFSDPANPCTHGKFGGMFAYVVDRTAGDWYDDIGADLRAM